MNLGKDIPKSPLKDMPIKSKVPLKSQAAVLRHCYMWEWNLLFPKQPQNSISIITEITADSYFFFCCFMLLYYLCH